MGGRIHEYCPHFLMDFRQLSIPSRDQLLNHERYMISDQLKDSLIKKIVEELIGQGPDGLYHARLKMTLLSASKLPGFNDRKWVNIRNMNPFTIVESRRFHAAEKCHFQPSVV